MIYIPFGNVIYTCAYELPTRRPQAKRNRNVYLSLSFIMLDAAFAVTTAFTFVKVYSPGIVGKFEVSIVNSGRANISHRLVDTPSAHLCSGQWRHSLQRPCGLFQSILTTVCIAAIHSKFCGLYRPVCLELCLWKIRIHPQ